MLKTLGYTDDVALAEYGGPLGLRKLEARLNSIITEGSEDAADMSISLSKTKILQIETQEVCEATEEEM